MSLRNLAIVAVVLTLAGCGESPSGFISIQSSLFFSEGDTLTCGRLEIRPKANGFLSGFYAVAPGNCDLTLHAKDSFFGTKICDVPVKENRITNVYLTRHGGNLSCETS